MINSCNGTYFFDFDHVLLDRLKIRPPKRPGFGVKFGVNFHPFEQCVVLKRKFQLVVMHYMKYNYLMATETKLTKGFGEVIRVEEQVRKNCDDGLVVPDNP